MQETYDQNSSGSMIAASREMTMSWEFTDRLRLDFSQNNGMENFVLLSFVLNARSFRQFPMLIEIELICSVPFSLPIRLG